MQDVRGNRPSAAPTAADSPGKAFRSIPPKLDTADPLVGALIKGRNGSYSIQGKLGEGGMGVVYLATDNASRSNVALKVISEKHVKAEQRTDMIGRFFREAISAKRIDHPNVIRMMDVGTFRDRIFCVMEYLEGIDLRQLIKKHRKLPWSDVEGLMVQICDGVQAAHDQGIMHRDLKPENIFLTYQDGKKVIKVLDFGLAKSVEGGDERLTKSGNVPGTLAYVAPEQVLKALGERGDYDTRADLYALGVVMYKLLTGEVPFKSDDEMELLLIRTKARPPKPSEVEPDIRKDVEDVIMHALEIDPDDRFQSARELKNAIIACRNGPAEGADLNDRFLDDILGRDVVEDDYDVPIKGSSIVAAPEIADYRAYRGEAPGRGALGKALGWGLALALTGGAAFGVYHYRDRISGTFNEVRKEYDAQTAPRPSASSSSSASPAQAEGYWMTIESGPQGATVYEMNGGRRGERLGSTPLQRRMGPGNHRLFVVRSGYEPKIITVSEEQPTHRVSLIRRQVRRAPAHDDEAVDVPVDESQ
jgi:serine/threonine protein kinase